MAPERFQITGRAKNSARIPGEAPHYADRKEKKTRMIGRKVSEHNNTYK